MTKWDALLAVQEHDTAADQLEHRKIALPERGELEQVMGQLAAMEVTAAAVEEQRHELARAQQRLEDDIATISTKAEQHDKTLYSGTVSNPRELQAMQDEIAALKRRIGQLEDQELELMEQIEPLDADLVKLTGERSDLDGRAGALRAAIAEGEVSIDAELAALRAERATVAASVEPELMDKYNELRPKAGGIAIARLVGGHCQGCHLALSAMEIDRIRKLPPEEPANCEECGRLLAR